MKKTSKHDSIILSPKAVFDIYISCLRQRGDIYVITGNYDKALADCNKGLGSNPSRSEEIKLKFLLANIHLRRKSDYDSVLKICNELLNEDDVRSSKSSNALALNICGVVHGYRGDLDNALKYYESALSSLRGTKLFFNIGALNNNMGTIYTSRGEFKKSIKYYKKANMYFEKISDLMYSAITLNNIGASHYSLGDHDEAEKYYVRYLDMAKKTGYRKGVATVLNSMALIYKERGEIKKAMEYFNNALKITKDLKDIIGECNILLSIGYTLLDLKKHEGSIKVLKKGYRIAKKYELKRLLGMCCINISSAFFSLGENEISMKYVGEALDIFKGMQDKYHLSQVYILLGQNCIEVDLKKAESFIDKAIFYAEQTEKKDLIIMAKTEKAAILFMKKDKNAFDFYECLLKDAERTGMKSLIEKLIKLGNDPGIKTKKNI